MSFSKKGDMVTPVIMWLSVLLALGIIVVWFMGHLKPVQTAQETMRFDLLEIKKAVERGCSSIYFTKEYNPRTEEGFLAVNQSLLCINASSFFDCVSLPCNVSNYIKIDLANLTFVKVAMDGNLTINKGE
jgi:hypothetical protein